MILGMRSKWLSMEVEEGFEIISGRSTSEICLFIHLERFILSLALKSQHSARPLASSTGPQSVSLQLSPHGGRQQPSALICWASFLIYLTHSRFMEKALFKPADTAKVAVDQSVWSTTFYCV